MLMGCTVVLHRKFKPADALRAMAEHRCSVLLAVPVMLSRILELPTAELATGQRVDLTFYWTESRSWEGRDYRVDIGAAGAPRR